MVKLQLLASSKALFSFTAVLGLFLCTGCSTTNSNPEPQREYELITAQDQLVEDVRNTPKEFIVPYTQEQAAWDRVLYFFSQYAGLKTPFITSLSSNIVQITNRHDKSASVPAYFYMIEKFPVAQGVKFRVHCFPNGDRGSRDLAETNARNVARFVKEGRLERSILAG